MKAHEIFRVLSTDEVAGIVEAACRDENVPDKIAGGVITYQNIPLKRFAKLPEETRKAYVRRTLRDKQASDLSLYVLSAALTRKSAALISAFLDALELPHEGPSLSVEGEIPEPPAKKLKAGVDALLAGYKQRDVAIYLHAFASQPDVHWPLLDERLTSDEKLRLQDLSGTEGAA